MKIKQRENIAQLILRVALGLGFIFPVLDRFGGLGPPGSKLAAWGTWQVFVAYTHTIIPFLPASLAAAVATAGETIFGVCLIIGYQTRVMAIGAALLTLAFALCMACFIGIYAPFIQYPVLVFTGGALLLSTLPDYRWSIDQAGNKKRPMEIGRQ